MSSTDRPHPTTVQEPVPEPRLDDAKFIRSLMFERDKSAFQRYRELVFRSYSLPKLIRYELLTTFIGPIPGALGLILRKLLFGSLFRKVGKSVIFGRSLTLRHADRITLGEGVVLDTDVVLSARGAGDEEIVIGNRVIMNRGSSIQTKVGRIEIGDDCSIGGGADIISQGPIILGANVSVAGKVVIAGGRYVVEHADDETNVKQRFTDGPIRIGDNVRIGIGAIIQDGVTIGENAIVAPGAVVFEDVPAETVVWGNPARPVRSRTAGAATSGTERGGASSSRADTARLQQEVCEYLEKDLFIEFGPEEFGVSDSLLESGVMDSLALVRLLSWTEQKFGVDLDFDSLDPSEVDSVQKIVGRLAERMP